jgi:hypothetical protein
MAMLPKLVAHEQMNELTRIFNDAGTDKASRHCYEHLYVLLFPAVLKVRIPELNILELGVQLGGGLCTLRSLFPAANLYGVDIELPDNRIDATLIHTDLSDRRNVESLYRSLSDLKFALIIDDASHKLRDQIMCVDILFHLLAPGGIYVIEDIASFDLLRHFKHLPGFLAVDLRLIAESVTADSICVLARQSM